MATNPDIFQKNLAFGQMAESSIARYLRSRGNLLLPIYDIEYETDKGPRLFLPDGQLVAPDLLVFGAKAPRIFWCECKHKTAFTWHRLTERWVTGIDQRHYQEYLKVADSTSIPVWIFFLHKSKYPSGSDLRHGAPHECPVGLFGNELTNLKENENHRSSKWGTSGMVYWATDSLKKIASIENLSA